jgi:hypothetical protein
LLLDRALSVQKDIFFDYMEEKGVPLLEQWRPWASDANSSYSAGFVQRYRGNFQYVTVRGSGHM